MNARRLSWLALSASLGVTLAGAIVLHQERKTEQLPRCSSDEIYVTGSGPMSCDMAHGQVLVVIGECRGSGVALVAHTGRAYCFDVDY